MGTLADLANRALRAQAERTVGITDAGAYAIAKGELAWSENPTVPGDRNDYPNLEGGTQQGGQYSEPAEGQLDGQVQRPGSVDAPGVDREASASHAPGSIVQGALDRGYAQRQATTYPQHTVSGMIAEASARHHVEVYGNSGSTQASPEGAFDSRLVDASQTDDRTFATFQIVVNRLVEAFRDATGPSPTFGAPQTQEDQEFLIAYGALRAAYWPDGSVDPYNGGEDNDF